MFMTIVHGIVRRTRQLKQYEAYAIAKIIIIYLKMFALTMKCRVIIFKWLQPVYSLFRTATNNVSTYTYNEEIVK